MQDKLNLVLLGEPSECLAEGRGFGPDALKGRKILAGGSAPGTVIRNQSDPEKVA